MAELKGHTDTVWSASFSPDGKKIVTASDDRSARVWDISGEQLDKTVRAWNLNGKQIAVLQHQDAVNSANISLDGKLIVTVCRDKTARVWDVNGKQIVVLQHQDTVNSANFSPNGKFIVTLSSDKTARYAQTPARCLCRVQQLRPGVKPACTVIVTPRAGATVRSGLSSNYKKIRVLPYNYDVNVRVSKSSRNWVKLSNAPGWVNTQQLQKVGN